MFTFAATIKGNGNEKLVTLSKDGRDKELLNNDII